MFTWSLCVLLGPLLKQMILDMNAIVDGGNPMDSPTKLFIYSAVSFLALHNSLMIMYVSGPSLSFRNSQVIVCVVVPSCSLYYLLHILVH